MNSTKQFPKKKSQHDKILQEDNFSRNRDNQNSNNSIKKEQVKRFNSTQNYYSMATFDDLQKNSELIEENLELYNETTNNSAFQDEDPNDEMNKTKKLDFYHRPSNHITEPSERHEPAVKKLTDPQEGLMGTNMIKLEDLDLKDYDYEDSLENIESGDKKIYSKVSPIKGQQPIKDITSYIDDLQANTQTEFRPFSPPMQNVLSLIDPNKTVITKKKDQTVIMSFTNNKDDDDQVDQMYDSVLDAYYDPNTNNYYDIKK